MPPDFPWFLGAVALAAVAWTVPKALNQARRFIVWILKVLGAAIGKAVVAELEEALAPSWAADFDDALEEALSPILAELKTNGGTSLKDRVHQIQRDLEPLVIEHRRRYNPPEGTPV